MELRRMTQFK